MATQPAIIEGQCATFPGRHSLCCTRSHARKVMEIAVLRLKKGAPGKSSNPSYFLTSTHLADGCVRWEWLSDCWFRKGQTTLERWCSQQAHLLEHTDALCSCHLPFTMFHPRGKPGKTVGFQYNMCDSLAARVSSSIFPKNLQLQCAAGISRRM